MLSPPLMMAKGELPPEGRTLSPLPPSLHDGLVGITVLATVSFLCSSILFLYLTYKLVAWKFFLRDRGERPTHLALDRSDSQPDNAQRDAKSHQATERQDEPRSSQQASDFILGIEGIFSEESKPQGPEPVSTRHADERVRVNSSPNQFFVLIYNLLLADMHQSIAFVLNASWLRYDGIMVENPTCFVQGLFVSTGDLSSSMFLTTIAIHTYLSVVKGYRPTQRTLYLAVSTVWIFVYAISVIPIAVTRNGASAGGFFVRAGAWCWMNREYEILRLLTHYLYIFIALATTSILYASIFVHLRRQTRRQASIDTDHILTAHASHNPAFLVYPVIYVICTLPLALGRIATMAGANVPLGYFCFAGALIGFNGFFDCLLFGTTRNAIVFASAYNITMEDTGLNTFAFLKTPLTRRYGNMVWIQGGRKRHQEENGSGSWWPWQKLTGGTEAEYRKKVARSLSQETLRGQTIQMDMVTTVVVEVDQHAERDSRYPNTDISASPSVNSTEKEYMRAV